MPVKIDCHLHLPVRDNLSSLKAQKDFLLQELQAHGVDYGIVIPDNVAESPIGGLEQCLSLFQDEKRIFLMASVNILDQPTSDVDYFDELFGTKKIVGLKIFPGHDEYYPNDARLHPYVGLCLKHNAPFVIHTGWNSGKPEAAKWNDPKYIIQLCDEYPGLKVVICHYFWPELEYCYRITRGYNNIFFDTSGLADEEVVKAIGKGEIKDILKRTIADNPKSVILGSDFGGCDISEHVALIESLDIAYPIKKAILSKNAIDVFRLEIRPAEVTF